MSHPDPTQQDRPNFGVQFTGMIQADSNEIATLKAKVERLTKERDQAIEAGEMRIGPDDEILMTPVTVLESEDYPDLFDHLKAREASGAR